MKVLIVTSKATSLTNVAKDVAYVLMKNRVIPRILTFAPATIDIMDMCDAVIFIYPASPLFSAKYFYKFRDYKVNAGKNCVFYATIEGRPTPYLVKRWMLRDVELVANSKYTFNRLTEVGFMVRDIIPHGLVREVVENARNYVSTFRKKLEEKYPDKVIFGAIAFWHRRKGLDLLYQAVKLLSSKRDDFVVYLVTNQETTDYLEETETFRVETAFGQRTREEVLAWMGALDYLIVPSLSEGFGLPLIEANSMGTPVIHCAYPPLTEHSNPDVNFIFEYEEVVWEDLGDGIDYELHLYNPKVLAEVLDQAIEIYKNNPKEYRRRCEEAKKVLERYDAEKLYSKFIQLLTE